MTDINLISIKRQHVRKQRAYAKRWLAICLIYSLVLLVGCGVYRVVWGLNTPDTGTGLLDLEAQARSIQKKIDRMQTHLVESKLSLQANRDLEEHPDWSLLLRFLAGMLGEDLFLRECDVQASSPSLPQATPENRLIQQVDSPASQPTVRLSIKGMGRSLEAVSQFTVRIEQTQLFTQVKLIDTHIEPYLKGKVIVFRVECTLGATAEGDG